MKPVLILLIIFFVVRFLRKSLQAKAEKRVEPGARKESQPGKQGEEMVLDPICNSYIPLSSAIKVVDGGRTEYFCTDACRDKFLASR